MAQLVAVKVLGNDGWGTDESVISGIDWVTQQHTAGNGGRRGTIISISVAGDKSDAINAAANNAVAAGIYVVVAAANNAGDACNYSPASAENVITVGATDINDKLASFSNYGKCVDILSPGVNVLSAFNRNDWDNIYMSGTSMATPQVSGVVATFAAMQGSMLSPAALFDVVKSKVNLNAISGIPDSATPNILVNNGSS